MAADGWDAVVLAGGRGRRLGGADKAAVTVGGRTLLGRVLSALLAAEPAVGRMVVVGPPRLELDRYGARVVQTVEDPPGGGPVAGLAAGFAWVRAPFVVVLAVDMPFLTPAHLAALRAEMTTTPSAGPDADVALLVDPDGRDQPLAAVWRVDALRAALPAEPAGRAMRALLAGRTVARVPADARGCLDCDAEQDLMTARALAAKMGL
ncbi:molybdenum cofactor guanylyltransferase [Frankia sp. CNm7]|uniref:Molybdenum cofactor guanylyltransferase n=2 Tax=Frankia nepalensis TaxID=1836974 RepID=A0A937RDU0_9ACTN|nr:molybdenum cofactor guanylyltransferase [Frankia nepalensis]MBL7498187.1 molybdenum cofactor guanylyltransferase [Frankia nepalensis]MBL7513153.1 molybdenum cofactor guanylyltransferase [Frankia nepalensis]MBL7521127.1 molybdenum cofactor guanylyltransferase [Frankia nepalensis]MBL7628417.1 molybdenum cofactor guanylyltransferase [Frankia nepalensis]